MLTHILKNIIIHAGIPTLLSFFQAYMFYAIPIEIHRIEKNQNITTQTTYITPDNIHFIGDIKQSQTDSINKTYLNLPKELRQHIEENNIEIIIIANEYYDINDKKNFDVPQAIGCYSTAKRSILRNDNTTNQEYKTYTVKAYPIIWIQVTNAQQMANTLLHEIGHCISDTYRDFEEIMPLAKTEKWCDLYRTYKEKINSYDTQSSENTYNEIEMFAECFRIYMTNPRWLLHTAPEIYHYIQLSIFSYTTAPTLDEQADIITANTNTWIDEINHLTE